MARSSRRSDQPLSARDVRLVRVVALAAVLGSVVDLVVVGHWVADLVVTVVVVGAVLQLGPSRRRQVLGLGRRPSEAREGRPEG